MVLAATWDWSVMRAPNRTRVASGMRIGRLGSVPRIRATKPVMLASPMVAFCTVALMTVPQASPTRTRPMKVTPWAVKEPSPIARSPRLAGWSSRRSLSCRSAALPRRAARPCRETKPSIRLWAPMEKLSVAISALGLMNEV